VGAYGRLVKLNAFACRDGYVLSNECMLAPREAEAVHGVMSRRLGIVDCHELPPTMCEAVIEAVYRDQFAFITIAQALHVDMKIHPPHIPHAGNDL
jgi:hypothetical protein